MTCLEENTLLGFVEGRLDGEARAAADAHIDGCEHCRGVVVALVRRAPAGTRIGRYVLLEPIGRGGMGLVHAAYDPELDRKIAVKLLRPDLVGDFWPIARERLLREGRAIARLSHPNVVAVHDVGTHGDGVFIAMELVDGVPLSEWRAEDPRRAIALMLQAGRGLAAAHAAGLVHRDFKPANVLVGKDGRVRVVDFGLARPPGEYEQTPAGDVDAQTPLTVAGSVVGTPLYMAPETLAGDRADARSDQYAFAQTLYEVLAGGRAFAGRSVRQLAEAKRRLALEPPQRRVPPAVLRVVRRALAADPAARWRDMDALLAELGNFLGRRRRIVVAAAGVAVIALGAGTPALLAQRDVCGHAEERLAASWDAARRDLVAKAFAGRKAAGIGARVIDRLDGYGAEWSAAYQRVCEATHARGEQSEALLDLRMRCLDERLRSAGALVTALLARDDGTTTGNAVGAAASLPAIAECDDVLALTVVVPPDPALRQRVSAATALAAEAEALDRLGHYDDAGQRARSAADAAGPLGYRALDARIALAQGSIEHKRGDYKASEEALARAAQAAAEARDDLTAARAWTLLVGVVGYLGGRPEEGLALARVAQAAVARAGVEDSVGAELDSMRGLVLDGLGRYDEARVFHERALAAREKTLGPEHLEVAQVLDNLGAIPLEQRDFVTAEKHYRRALAIRRRALGDEHPDVAASWNSLSAALEGRGDFDGARDGFQRALAIWQRTLGGDHPNIAAALNNLGNLDRKAGRHAEARPRIEEAIAMWRRLGSEHAASVAIGISNLGAVAHALGDLVTAEARYLEAIPLLEQALGAEHPRLGVSLANLAHIQLERARPAEAEVTFRRALALREKKLGAGHADLADVLVGLGLCRLAAGDAPGALPSLERAHRQAGEPRIKLRAAWALARALWGAGRDRSRALVLAREAAADAELRAEVEPWLAAHGR